MNDGKDAVIFKAGDANDLAKKVLFLYEHKELMQKISLKAKERVLLDNLAEKVTEKLLEIYRDIIIKSKNKLKSIH